MHLLLEGDRGCGKSTLILEAIRPHLQRAGGFGTVRLFDEDGAVRGYAQVEPAELDRVNRRYQEGQPNIFLERDGERSVTHESVLLEHTLPLLEREADFYLLDEIGGGELLLAPWRRRLTQIFEGDTPSIGVWKSEDNCWKLRKKSPEFAKCYQEMREWLLAQAQVRLITVTAANRGLVQEEIQNWMNEWL